MRKYLAYYETEWPANIAELTAVENKPFVGYLKGLEVKYTVIPEPVTGPADNEIWYTTVDGNPHDFFNMRETLERQGMLYSGPEILSNTYDSTKQIYIATFDNTITGLGLELTDDDNMSSLSFKHVIIAGSSISKIWLPNKIECLKYLGLQSNNELTELIIPESVSYITKACIFYNSSLSSISIPNNVLKIKQTSFVGLPSLENIEFRGTIEQWNNIDKEENWIVECPLATYVQCSDGQVAL